MKHYSLVIEPKLVEEIDKLIKKHGLFSSRSDFIRDSIRARLLEVKKTLLEEKVKEKPDKKELEREEKIVDEVMEESDEHKYGGVH